jgi:threonine synthase
MGGLLAFQMGLPVKKFVVATNENDEVPVYLTTGAYKTIVPSKACISSAMNVGHPSNMARVIALYGGVMDEQGVILAAPDLQRLRKDIFGTSIDDRQTRDMMKTVYARHKVVLEPHGAVGWAGLQKYFKNHPDEDDASLLTVTLETAHPAKFPDEIRELLGFDPELPESMKGLDQGKESLEKLSNDYAPFKTHLLKQFS